MSRRFCRHREAGTRRTRNIPVLTPLQRGPVQESDTRKAPQGQAEGVPRSQLGTQTSKHRTTMATLRGSRLQALPGPSPAYPGHSQQARLHQAPGRPRWLPSQCPSPPLTPFLSPPVPGCCAHLCWPGHKHLRTWGALALLRARAQSLPLTGHGPRAYVTSSLSLCLFIRTKRSV